MEPAETSVGLSRRKVLLAGAGTALGVSVLAACGDDEPAAQTPTTTPSGDATSSGGEAPSGDATPSGGVALAKVADVPVGGAVAAESSDGKPVIVAQPTKGNVVAFSAICTHQGCIVAPSDDILACPCHGSTYDLATGENTGGPAPSPLPEFAVEVRGGDVVEV